MDGFNMIGAQNLKRRIGVVQLAQRRLLDDWGLGGALGAAGHGDN